MLKRMSAAAAVFLTLTSIAGASEPTLSGVVTRSAPEALNIRTDRGETATVTVNADTQYRKWIMAKPWQQDPRAAASSVTPGTRVRVELAEGNAAPARTVWIVVR